MKKTFTKNPLFVNCLQNTSYPNYEYKIECKIWASQLEGRFSVKTEIQATGAFAPVLSVNGSEAIQAHPAPLPQSRPLTVCAPCIIEHAANYCHAWIDWYESLQYSPLKSRWKIRGKIAGRISVYCLSRPFQFPLGIVLNE